MKLSIFKNILIFTLLFAACNVNALPSRLIENVSVNKEKGFDVITVKLSVPLHYTHHFPKTKSRTVVINVRAFSNDAKIVLTSSDNEKYRLPRKKSKLLSYLRVESLDNNVGKIAVQFKQKLKFSVRQINKKTIKIILGKSGASKKLATSKKAKKRRTKSKKFVSSKKVLAAKRKKASNKKKVKRSKKSNVVNTRNSKITYVLNLESYQKGKKPRKIPKLDVFKKYKLFRTRVKKKKVLITRLRLGFFRSKTEAERVKRQLKVYYPNTFVTLIQKNESSLSTRWFEKNKITPKKVRKVVRKKPKKKLTKKQVSKVDKLFAKGKLALVEKNFRIAISFFTKVSEIGRGDKKQQALEFIGLAREKNGQIAHAKAEYKKYLKLYPDGIGHERVKQRLEGLLTAQLAPKRKLVSKKKEEKESSWDYFSTVSQNYRNQISVREEGQSTTDNSVSSYFNTSGRKRGEKYDLKFQFDMDHRYDFTKDARKVSDFGLSTAYFDYISLTGLGTVRLGRQSRSSGGILGRFDGVWYGYPLTNDVKLNLVAGLPVVSSSGVSVNSEQQVFGVSADFDEVLKRLDISTFLVQQNRSGIVDRRAVGTEIRFIADRSSYFGILDYDINFNRLNTVQFVGNWLFKNNASVNFVFDRRSSPIITTSNALIGQGFTTLQELRNIISDEEIKKLAIARTSSYDSLSLSGNYPINNTYSLSADLNISKTGSSSTTFTPENVKFDSNGNPILDVNGNPGTTVAGTQAVGPDYFYGITLIGSNLFSKRDTNILTLRQSTGSSRSTSIDARSQFNLNKKWRMRPRLRYDIRTRSVNASKSNRITTSTRFDYRYTRELQFQMEVTADFTTTTTNGLTSNDTDYSIDLSYIYDF
ncbi:hypothetical protein MNBD_GAMMA22-1030 [hydrothermal vent metagenome]|uniref:SPOR domain-containing protein n=1 Tax=hydrothermal vent metagenome TaxID=652676 RepID=A0A3B0ZSY1_9ZZZZ